MNVAADLHGHDLKMKHFRTTRFITPTRLARVGLAFALALALPTMAAEPTAEEGLASMRARLTAVPGYAGVFGIIRGDSIATGTLGDARPGVPHASGTALRWASVSKMITAIMVLQQVDSGLIELDAPLARYLPESGIANADRISIRQLLAHRSGLAGQLDPVDGPPGDPIGGCKNAAAEPGSVFLYNNCDTIVLGKVLEAVTGTPYLALANQTIGHALGVSFTLPDEPRVEATLEDGSPEPPAWPSAYGPAGGLYGTASDLLRIDAALMQGRLLSPESLATMLTGDPSAGYAALGVWSHAPDLGACLGKTRLVERYGEIGGVQVRNFLLPDKGIAIVVYSNDHRTVFGEVWQGKGLSVDLIRLAVCAGQDDKKGSENISVWKRADG